LQDRVDLFKGLKLIKNKEQRTKSKEQRQAQQATGYLPAGRATKAGHY